MEDQIDHLTFGSEAQKAAVNDFIESEREAGAFIAVNTSTGAIVITLVELDEDEVVIGHETHIIDRLGTILA